MITVQLPRNGHIAPPTPAEAGMLAATMGQRGNIACPFSFRTQTDAWFSWWRSFLAAGGKP